MSGLSGDIERLAVEVRERDMAAQLARDPHAIASADTPRVFAAHVIASDWLAERDAAIRAEAKAEALREMSQKFRTEAAEVWGGNLSWLTTGRKVADLVSFWCDDEADRIGGDQ